MKKLILTFLFLLSLMSAIYSASKQIVVDSVKISSNILVIDFTVDGIIDQKAAEGLRKGLTSTIEYQIQLWEKKSGWINNLVISHDVRMKVYYDNWENKYVIMSAEEKRLTNSIETVREKCSKISNLSIFPVSKMKENGNYFITVKAILRPLSVENYQEIKNWISGQAKNMEFKNLDDTKNQEKKIKGGVLKMLLALTGFGDRVVSGRCEDFQFREKSILWGNNNR